MAGRAKLGKATCIGSNATLVKLKAASPSLKAIF